MPSSNTQRSGTTRVGAAAFGGSPTSPIAHAQSPGNRVVCRTLTGAINALRTA